MEFIHREGQALFEKRLKFADTYMVYHRNFRDQEKRIHAIADAHTHLMQYYFVSPRIGFWSPQGGCGKSNCLKISYFHASNPMYEVASGAGLLRKIHAFKQNYEGYPTLLLDEAQRTLSLEGSVVSDYLSEYTKGAARTIQDEGRTLTMEMFGPVFLAGLTNETTIRPNFLERNIQLPLERPLPDERAKTEMLSFALLKNELEDEDGNCELRDNWANWADKILAADTMKNVQDKMVKLIKPKVENDGRKVELALPLVQTAFFVGDGLHELILDDLVYLWDRQDIKYTLGERLLIDLHEIISNPRNVQDAEFIPTSQALFALKMIDESPWLNYRGKELNPESMAFLLASFGLKPRQDRHGKTRGYYVREFIDPWKRAVKLEKPEWMKHVFDQKIEIRTNNITDGLDGFDGFDGLPRTTPPREGSAIATFRPF
jgi:Protein of unknown function (DUF3631)